MVPVAAEVLRGSGVHLASVATAFPSGQAPLEVKLADTRDAVAAGADEIDMVISRGAFLAGDYAKVFDEIVAVKEAAGPAHLKVILETGELGTYDNVRRASWLAMLAGADFIKTSTGKVPVAATLPVTLVMLEAVRDFRAARGRQVGVKPAGGIRTTKDAIKYLVLVNETVGDDWLSPDWFRFGASSLLNDLLMQRTKLTTGHYAGPDYFTLDEPMFEYAPAPESRAIVEIASSYGLFIDGAFDEGTATFKTVNPATEEVLAEVALAGAGGRRPGGGRRPHGVPEMVGPARRRAGEVSVPDRPDHPGALARTGRAGVAGQRQADHASRGTSTSRWSPRTSSTTRAGPTSCAYAGFGPDPRPLGVAGQVIPWNFPLLMLAWKIAPALAAGNTVVLKPAETTPLSALFFADICRQADLPPGVVNIVTGAGDTGRYLVEHPDVNKVAFTGSTEVGRQIARSVAGTGKRLTLELGGKAANIVFDDAPIDQAVEGIVNGIFFNQGHVCCAGSRLLVQESMAEEVLSALKRRMATLRVGDPLDKNTDIGAINSAAQLAKITELSEIGSAEGAERWSPPCELPDRGFWFAPTIFTGVTQAHRIAREEIFGPVLSVLTFRTPDEAIEKANNTPYGLSAGIWTEKGSRILAVADQLRAGVVWANTFNKFDPTSPFGGYKESGYGREGGRHGLEAYLA